MQMAGLLGAFCRDVIASRSAVRTASACGSQLRSACLRARAVATRSGEHLTTTLYSTSYTTWTDTWRSGRAT